jgi:hypothetical protein
LVSVRWPAGFQNTRRVNRGQFRATARPAHGGRSTADLISVALSSPVRGQNCPLGGIQVSAPLLQQRPSVRGPGSANPKSAGLGALVPSSAHLFSCSPARLLRCCVLRDGNSLVPSASVRPVRFGPSRPLRLCIRTSYFVRRTFKAVPSRESRSDNIRGPRSEVGQSKMKNRKSAVRSASTGSRLAASRGSLASDLSCSLSSTPDSEPRTSRSSICIIHIFGFRTRSIC